MTTTNFKLRTATVVTALMGPSWALPALALAPLEGRTITGDRVDAYAANAVMIYDPNANLTWLRDWNVNGSKFWVDQLIWASSLQVGTFGNWSLPTARNQDGSDPCSGFNCTDSQMGYLFYQVLGSAAHSSATNFGPFQNVQRNGSYWTGTGQLVEGVNFAWSFSAHGYQGLDSQPDRDDFYAVAVRLGDVAAAVPEPQTWAMLLLGLGTLTVAARRRPD